MKNFFLIYAISIVILTGCQNKQQIEYINDIKCDKEIKISSTILNDSFLFSSPNTIFDFDSLLVIFDTYQQELSFHIFSKETGTWIKSFGTRGNGPGELTYSIDASVDKKNNMVIAYDINQRKIVRFNLLKVLEHDPEPYQEYKFPPDKTIPTFVQAALPYKGKFLLRGNNDNMRFGILDKEQMDVIYKTYPDILPTEQVEETWAVLNYGLKWKLSPDEKQLVTGTYIGGILELFSLKDTIITPITLLKYFSPKYNIVRGTEPAWITWNEETIGGFRDIVATNEGVYALVIGEKIIENSPINRIIFFDWSGNPKIKYVIDKSIRAFSIDEQNRVLYMITGGIEDPILIKANVPVL